MKSLEYINSLCEKNRLDWISEYRDLHRAEKALEEIYSITCTKTPADTLSASFQQIGEEMTKALIATYVNQRAWDGRISKRAAEWAKTIESAWDEKGADRIGLYGSRIHSAHLDQLAMKLIRG